MTLLRMDNIGIVVKDMQKAIAFFMELGMELEGQATVEGLPVGRLVALQNVRANIATLKTPGGHGRVELTKYLSPELTSVETPVIPVNAPGIRRIMFAVEDINEVLSRLRKHGASLLGEIVDYEGVYKLAYIRGPEGILIALAQSIQTQK